jgi:peptidoglycan DL-endopeptidase LytE
MEESGVFARTKQQLGYGLMKGRHRIAVCLAAITLLFVSASSYAKTTTTLAKSHPKAKKVKPDTPIESKLTSRQTYVVRKGDSLFKIARENRTTAKALKAANGLVDSKIKAGQKLIIPGSQVAETSNEPPKAKSVQNEQIAAQYISQLKSQNPTLDEESQPARLRLVEAGFKMIGIRYRRSGVSEKTGFDCSGLVKSLFSKFNIDLPRSSREQYQQGEVIDRDNLQVGDLVFFSSGGTRPTHVGIYVGDDKFLHAAIKARQVIVSDLNKFWYTMRYLGARRIADLWWDETQAAPEEEQ